MPDGFHPAIVDGRAVGSHSVEPARTDSAGDRAQAQGRTSERDEAPSCRWLASLRGDRKSTRLNSSHSQISYAVFCLKKKKKNTNKQHTNKCTTQERQTHE